MIPNLKTKFVNNRKLGLFHNNFQINKRKLIFEEIIIIQFVNVEYHSNASMVLTCVCQLHGRFAKDQRTKGYVKLRSNLSFCPNKRTNFIIGHFTTTLKLKLKLKKRKKNPTPTKQKPFFSLQKKKGISTK
jgi:hypothetical protein